MVVGFVSLMFGVLVWYLLYFGLAGAFTRMKPLSDQEEAAFKVGYLAMSVFSAAVALGAGSWLAQRTRASRILGLVLTVLLIVSVVYPLGLISSVANDCSLHIESFPFPVGGCE